MADGDGTFLRPANWAGTKSLERYTAKHGIDAEVQKAAQRFAAILRKGGGKDANRLATAVDQICAALPRQDDEDEPGELKPAPVPSAAGDQLVLVPLKVTLGMLPAEAASETTVCGPDRYAMLTHSPLASAHGFLTRLLEEKIQAVKWGTDLDAFAAGQAILGLDPSPRSMVLMAAMERNSASIDRPCRAARTRSCSFTVASILRMVSVAMGSRSSG